MKTSIKRLDSVTHNDTTATKLINDNFQALQQGVEDSLSRTGKTPNFMDAVLDMNSYRIINVGEATEDTDVVNKKYVDEKTAEAVEASKEAVSAANVAKESANSAAISANKANESYRQTVQAAEEAIADIEDAVEDGHRQVTQEVLTAIDTIDGKVATAVSTVDTAANEAVRVSNEAKAAAEALQISAYTKPEVNSLLQAKQDKLIAGENITIIDNVISSQGGSGGGEEHITLELTGREVTDLYLAGKTLVLDDGSKNLYRLNYVNPRGDGTYFFIFQTLVEDAAHYWTISTEGYWNHVYQYFTTSTEFAQLENKVNELQLFKFPNAVIIGEPTIQNGQVSDFSTVSYLQFPFELDLRDQPFQIDFSFTTAQNVQTQQNILDSNFGIALAIQGGKGVMAISSNGTSWDVGLSTGTMTLQSNTTYYARLTWDRLQYKTYLSTDGVTYTQDMVLVGAVRPYPRTIFIGGCNEEETGHTPHPFLGTINLNKAFLSVRGNVIWSGMDDAGLSTRADISLSNLDPAGIKVINDIIESRTYDGSVE